MNTREKKKINSMLERMDYDCVIAKCASKKDSDELYFLALALDQSAAVRNKSDQSYRRFLQRSRSIIEIGLKRFPQDNRFYFLSGLNFLHAGTPKKALLTFEELFSTTKDLKILLSIANAQRSCGQIENALRTYKKLLHKRGYRYIVWYNIANTYREKGNILAAKRAARVGLKIKPKNKFDKIIEKELRSIVL